MGLIARSFDPTADSSNWYWVIPGRFLAGPYPGALDDQDAEIKLRKLLDIGINEFIDLTEENENGLKPYIGLLNATGVEMNRAVTHSRFPIQDLGIPSKDEMERILDYLDVQLEIQKKIFLHCWGGIGRTGLVVGCFLVRKGLSGEHALARLAELRQHTAKSSRHSPETEAQRQFLLTWNS